MDFKEIQELLKLINRLDLSEFKMKDGEFELSIRTKNYEKGRNQGYQGVIQETYPAPQPAPVASIPSAVPSVVGTISTAPPVSGNNTSEKATDHLIAVKSPIVGTFYRSSSPDKPAFVKVGDTISAGDVVCVVEAMKLFNEIESEFSGTIEKILVEDAQPVEYDQVLFLLNPKG
ncbi:MAG: acetyl-CoA carboxylase biotin carboxyl carrier protein [Saprospiraceae bacterium]|jgi:acetyl-CoA carboxylase biotin carboxyl carrier protein